MSAGFEDDTLSPDGIDRTIIALVNRDTGDSSLASNWFELCELDKLSPYTVEFVGLFVDGSGSMELETVQASYDKFVNIDSKAAGLEVASVYHSDENWILPFRNKLVPSSR